MMMIEEMGIIADSIAVPIFGAIFIWSNWNDIWVKLIIGGAFFIDLFLVISQRDKLSKYKHKGGVPGKGIHKFQIFGIALIDLFGTLLFATISYFVFGGYILMHVIYWILTGEWFHFIYSVRI